MLKIILAFLRIEEVGTLDIAISSVAERLIFLNLLQGTVLKTDFDLMHHARRIFVNLLEGHTSLIPDFNLMHHVNGVAFFCNWLNIRNISTNHLYASKLNKSFIKSRPLETYSHVKTIFFFTIIDRAEMIAVMRKCQELYSVTFHSCHMSIELIEDLRTFPNLTEIIFIHPDDCVEHIPSIPPFPSFGSFIKLKKIQFIQCQSRCVTTFLETILQQCCSSTIEDLAISDCKHITLEAILAITPDNMSIKRLNFGNIGGSLKEITQQHRICFGNKFSNLQSLGLSHFENMTDGDLLSILSTCKDLKDLDISMCGGLTSESFAQITGLHSFKALGTEMTSSDYVGVIERSHNLYYMDAGPIFDDTVLCALASYCPLLKTLIVSHGIVASLGKQQFRITKIGLKRFFDGCLALKHLQLQGYKFTIKSHDWESIARYTSLCKYLEVVILDCCEPISLQAVLLFIHNCPKLFRFNFTFGEDVDILSVCRLLSQKTRSFRFLKNAAQRFSVSARPRGRLQRATFLPHAMCIDQFDFCASDHRATFLPHAMCIDQFNFCASECDATIAPPLLTKLPLVYTTPPLLWFVNRDGDGDGDGDCCDGDGERDGNCDGERDGDWDCCDGDGDEEFLIEAVLSHCGTIKEGLKFLIRWDGYNESDDSWEPWSALMENDIVHAYCRMNKMDAIIATKFDKIDFDSFFRFDQGKVFRKKPV